MKNIFINLKRDELLIEKEIISFKNHLIIQEFKKNIDYLAGCLLLVDNMVLLVKPLKHKGQKHKWSIPKGHIEKGDSEKKTALKELKEETGIKLKKISNKHNFFYKKNDTLKKITVYLKRMTKADLDVSIKKTFELKGKFNKDEIYKVKLFSYEDALKKIEPEQKPILDTIMKELNEQVNTPLTNEETNIMKNIVIPFIHKKHKSLLEWAKNKNSFTGLELEKVALQYLPHKGTFIMHLVCHGHMRNHANRMISSVLHREINKKLDELNFDKSKIEHIIDQNGIQTDNFLVG